MCLRGMHLVMEGGCSVLGARRELAAARPGDGSGGWGGRVAVLAGAARRGAALFGSLLIAAVPSSPIESG